jgi:hypothetical protein
VFERSISQVRVCFRRIGLGGVFDGVRRIRVVREESFHDERDGTIGLNPADARKPYAAFRSRPYLLIHELGHAFATCCLTARDKRRLEPLFGDCDRPYRRGPKPRRCGADFVSRYAETHPAEDFAETFAVCLWRDWQPERVARLLRGRSRKCLQKLRAVSALIRREARRRTAFRPPPARPGDPPG